MNHARQSRLAALEAALTQQRARRWERRPIELSSDPAELRGLYDAMVNRLPDSAVAANLAGLSPGEMVDAFRRLLANSRR